MPRLVEGNVALQVLAASTKSPRHLNIERNDDSSDDVVLLALALGWPPATWRRLLPRALYLASRADRFAARSGGRLRILRTAADLAAYDTDRRERPGITAGVLAIEGAHALDDDPANVEVVADAGFRMLGPAHFFDNAFAGSAHGVEKGGLTDAGREMIRRMEARSMLVDVAHASSATVDDVLAIATRPVVASHTGLRSLVDNARNLTDDQARGIADSGGVLGIGFWPTVCGGDTATDIARAIRQAIGVAGVEHVGARLRLRRCGAGAVRFDRAWCCSRTPCSRPVSTRMRSGRSWAATSAGCWPTCCPDATGSRRPRRHALLASMARTTAPETS